MRSGLQHKDDPMELVNQSQIATAADKTYAYTSGVYKMWVTHGPAANQSYYTAAVVHDVSLSLILEQYMIWKLNPLLKNKKTMSPM